MLAAPRGYLTASPQYQRSPVAFNALCRVALGRMNASTALWSATAVRASLMVWMCCLPNQSINQSSAIDAFAFCSSSGRDGRVNKLSLLDRERAVGGLDGEHPSSVAARTRAETHPGTR